MAAIPILIYDGGFCEEHKGTLYNPPAEFFTRGQKSFYSLAKPGWQKCPLGYSIYVAFDALGRKIVVPAIYLSDEAAPRKKFPNMQRFSKNQIEEFAKSHLSIFNEIREKRDIEFKNLTHDLRAISNEIYHGALEVKELASISQDQSLTDQIDRVLNSQQMMSMRLDIIDYESGSSSSRPSELIEPYRKVDKVIRCFSGKMQARNIRYRIEGRFNDHVLGPPIFEIVPFVVIENALKYAPGGSEVIVKFNEEPGKLIIRIDSLGPKISEKEKTKIFDKNYRGEAVRNSRSSGSGIGLFAARTIVETHFGGRIFVNQFNKVVINMVEFYETRFTIVLPSQENERRQIKTSRRTNFLGRAR